MLFDTSIVIDVMRSRRQYQFGSISAITLLELVRSYNNPEEARKTLYDLRQAYRVHEVDDETILAHRLLYQALRNKKETMSDSDLIIAAASLAKSERLVTKDTDFKKLSGLLNVSVER